MVETPQIRENFEFNRQASKTPSIRSSISSNSADKLDPHKGDVDNGIDKGIGLEATSKGKIKGSLAAHYFKAGAHWTILLFLLFTFIFTQFLASAVDYWVSVW